MPNPTPLAAKPTRNIFDAWNSSATGHQRAENRLGGSTSWRDSRSLKLRDQFTAGQGGGKRLSDTVGAGSLDFGIDGRKENGAWERGAAGLRTDGQKSIWESMKVEKDVERPSKRLKEEEPRASTVVSPFIPFRKADGSVRESSWTSHESSPSHLLSPIDAEDSAFPASPSQDDDNRIDADPQIVEQPCPQIFAGLKIYINGSTAPAISDHKLKHLLSTHGARMSIALGRRTVTHVILGRPNSASGAGGGLAGSKIQKEIARIGGKGVKYVSVEWVLESIKNKKRLPESRFEALRLAPKGVGSVFTMFRSKEHARKQEGLSDRSAEPG